MRKTVRRSLVSTIAGAVVLSGLTACSSAGPAGSSDSPATGPDPVARSAPDVKETARPVASATLPARAIPEEYVQTPSGWAHPSCIHEVPNGAVVDDRKGDVTVDGKVIAHYDPCPYEPVFDAAITPDSRQGLQGPGNYSGWVEYAQQNAPSGDTWSSVQATMWVPPAPAQTSGTLYYFPGLQSSISSPPGGCGIMQPVLQWGGSPAGGGQYWSVGAWWWSVNGSNNGYHSPLSTVNTNESIAGQMLETYPGLWTISAIDNNTGGGQVMYITSTACDFNQAFPAVTEAQNGGIASCSDVPYNYVNFTNISLEYTGLSGSLEYSGAAYAPSKNIPVGTYDNCGWAIGIGDTSNYGWVTTLWQ